MVSTNLRVLVVDSNPLTRWVYRLSLEIAGYEVQDVASGKAALDRCADERLDLILFNLRQDDMPGLELARRLRDLQNGTHLPLLAYADEQHLPAADEDTSALTTLLARPFLPSYLILTCQFYLRRHPVQKRMTLQVSRARLSRESFSEEARASRMRKPPSGQRILVVEDVHNDRNMLAERLAEQDYMVETEPNGAKAIERALRELPDAIVTDTLMPVMDGLELCLLTRLVYRLAMVPIVVTPGGHVDELDRTVFLALGANAVVARAPDFHKVADALQLVLTEETPSLPHLPSDLPVDRRQLLALYQPAVAAC